MLRKHQEEQEKLELKNVSKSFGDNRVLDNISLNVETGNIVSILGPSGCGKTTLLNVILGLTDLTGGQILFDGEDVSRLPMKKRGFNIVFQDFALFPNTMQDGANNCRTISHPNLYCTHRQESRIFSISIRSSHRLSGSMYCLYFRTH